MNFSLTVPLNLTDGHDPVEMMNINMNEHPVEVAVLEEGLGKLARPELFKGGDLVPPPPNP